MTFVDPNVSDVTGVLMYTNTVTDGLTGMVLILTIFVGATLTIPSDFPTKLGGGAFIAAMSSILFFVMGVVAEQVVVVTVILTGASFIFLLSIR